MLHAFVLYELLEAYKDMDLTKSFEKHFTFVVKTMPMETGRLLSGNFHDGQ